MHTCDESLSPMMTEGERLHLWMVWHDRQDSGWQLLHGGIGRKGARVTLAGFFSVWADHGAMSGAFVSVNATEVAVPELKWVLTQKTFLPQGCRWGGEKIDTRTTYKMCSQITSSQD